MLSFSSARLCQASRRLLLLKAPRLPRSRRIGGGAISFRAPADHDFTLSTVRAKQNWKVDTKRSSGQKMNVKQDPSTDFGTTRCVRLLMDLFYKEKRFSDIVNLWPICDNPLTIGFHIDIENYVFVALYLMNTREALEKCLEIISKHPRWKLLNSPKCFSCITMLALNQNEPGVAMEVMSSTLFSQSFDSQPSSYVNYVDPSRNPALENVKMLTYLRLDRVDEAVNILASLASPSMRDVQRKSFLHISTIEAFDDKLTNHDDMDLKNKYFHLRQSFDRAHMISPITTHDYILKPLLGKVDNRIPESHSTALKYRPTHSVKPSVYS